LENQLITKNQKLPINNVKKSKESSEYFGGDASDLIESGNYGNI
jgi:hypothetical protein